MKNISRRTFIKGMAVAAVATAASSVLAGCNFVPGTVEETPVAGFTPESKVFDFGDDGKFTLSTTGFATAKSNYNKTYNDLAVLSLTAVNGLESAVWMPSGNKNTTAADVQVYAYFDDKGTKATNSAMTTMDNDLYHVQIAAANDTVTATTKGNLYFNIPEAQKDWKMITFVFTLDGEEVQFVVNK